MPEFQTYPYDVLVIGAGGAGLRAAIGAADLPASGRATREAMDVASLAAEDLRRSLPAIRESLGQLRELARQLQEQPESVVHGIQQARTKPK